ncbi:hypothetical protein [Formosa haliotis]|uniref:hypothetical protein n=1 Tax=Formosa haliotis TaxID=1555194 RepID=UPI0008268179|nr:hypothetical protein [Formosa haliotis]
MFASDFPSENPRCQNRTFHKQTRYHTFEKNSFHIDNFSFPTKSLLTKEIVGKVEYYISNNYDIPSFAASSEKTIKYLNSRRQQIELIQGNSITEIKTDTTGIFKINIKLDENLKITVNKKSKLLASEFQFSSNQLNDTLKLRITDEKMDIYKDSIASPKFYNMYSENQAYSDFENGKKRILTGAGFVSKESSMRRKKLSKNTGLNTNLFTDV